jgi:hypothetical protein
MKSTVVSMNSQNSRRLRFAFSVQLERMLNRSQAFLDREQFRDVSSR